MTLLPNWQAIACRAWSMWLIALAGLLSAVEAVLPLIGDIPWVPRGAFAAATFLVTLAAAAARLLAQASLTNPGVNNEPSR